MDFDRHDFLAPREFTVTANHLTLLRHLYVVGDGPGPEISRMRPYGSTAASRRGGHGVGDRVTDRPVRGRHLSLLRPAP